MSGGLLTSGAVELFFRYRESVEAIEALQREVAPAVTEAVALDADGRERLKVSRIRMLLPEDLRDRSMAEAFMGARGGRSYFGQAYFVRESEPYMTIAVPIERFAGDVLGVLIAEVNLK